MRRIHLLLHFEKSQRNLEKSKEFFKSILDQDLEPNFRPKQPCGCPKIAKLSVNQLISGIKFGKAH